MIPAAFDYVRPSSVEQAAAALGNAGEDAKVLAGGQSLLAVLRLRLAAPTVVVDLGGIAALRGIRVDGDALVIGAMTTHAEVAASALVREEAALVAATAALIGDRQVRHRGTLGGSVAHADPAGDLPTVAVALDATMVLVGPGGGRRTVAAADFFSGMFTTVLAADEILVEVRFPRMAGWRAHYEKFHRTAQAWALVGAAAAVRRDNGAITGARVALTNMGPTPVRASGVESALMGARDRGGIAAAAAHAVEGVAPLSDVSASADYRRHLAGVLTARAVAAAAGL